MGEVYGAKDSRLGREVAIEVLPSSFADVSARRARFEREAQAVAALSHPNVIAIFDTGLYQDQLYVVIPVQSVESSRSGHRGRRRNPPVRRAPLGDCASC